MLLQSSDCADLSERWAEYNVLEYNFEFYWK